MNRIWVVSMCALLALAASASAAKVTYLSADATTAPADWLTAYGSGDYFLWDYSSGRPDWKDAQGNMKPPVAQTNPAYVKEFKYHWSGGNGGGGGGNSTKSSGHVYYDLTLNAGKSFEFLAGFYDKDYGQASALKLTDVAIQVRLIDPSAAVPESWHEIEVGDLRHGIILKWDVTLKADEKLTMEVEWVNGEGTAAAAFFLNSVKDATAIPEPATVGLMLFGLAGIFVRRSRK